MKRLIILLTAVCLFSQCHKPEFQKKDLIVTGTSDPVININGIWKFTMTPPEDFFRNETPVNYWKEIKVPGECAMQGFAIKHNTPYVYKRQVQIPYDFAGKVIKLRFEGVYSYARVWVNGTFIRDHSGGFTAWDCDITQNVTPGTEAWVTVEFTDMANDLSFASGYAKHPIGGILRNVSLRALPYNFPESVQILTDFDQKYRDADLKIKVVPGGTEKSWIGFRLYDIKGNPVNIKYKRYPLKKESAVISIPVKNPVPWDSEHPNLYTLIVEVFDKSILTSSYRIPVGFREIEIKGNKLLVNGMQVKLRGACRHDIDPLLGRTSTYENDSLDALLAKEANMNFIRTSHYPPSESFLKFCDLFGIYVEDESAVCFVDTHRGGIYRPMKQSGDEFFSRQASQIREMVNNHYNHPSVIIWSLGNESTFNPEFKRNYDYIKSADASRPVIFSYPGSVPDSIKSFDLLSLHYPSYNGNLNQWGITVKKFNYGKMPVIYDEWAHVACYNKPELLTDRNVRSFWGQSLDSMWTNIYNSEGTGGAIWGMIDETFMLPDTMSGYNKWWGVQEQSNGVKMFEGPAVGYGEWGIIDTWRRKKPEFWNTKKAYSPVKILIDEITDFQAGWPIMLPVYNRFNHTNLKEVTAKWTYDGREVTARFHNIAPSEKGELQLSPSGWQTGKYINIKFFMNDSMLIDEYNICLGKKEFSAPEMAAGKIKAVEFTGGKVKITGNSFSATLNKKTGLLEDIISGNDTLISSGPWIHWKYPAKDHWSVVPFEEAKMNWKTVKTDYEIKDSILYITVKGQNEKRIIELNYRISDNGTIEIAYKIEGIPEKSRADEFGLKFYTGTQIDSLTWDRKSYWNSYPPNHLGSSSGKISLKTINNNLYRQKPGEIWEYDNSSFFYNGLSSSDDLSYMAGSLKENIWSYTVSTPANSGISVISDAKNACRISKSGNQYILYINRYWDYLSLNWGNYMKNELLPEIVTDTIYLKLSLKR
jgi:beta-galactosidase